MPKLNAEARETLDFAGFTPKQWAKIHFNDGVWHGDECGCSDDRCIGHHHETEDDCQCLPAMITEVRRQEFADRAAGPIWTAYQAAVEAGDEVARQAAQDAAETWVKTYKGAGMTSCSLDEIVDGKPGISYTNIWNDRRWLLWSPEAVTAS
ncbi:hypothetical protein [Leifsonia sp. P73]|uniref:hypothetical protein n=1 Tax=Leifsonia sp. P73 TaxID=3423959 RepID=UPI003DA4508B